MRHKTRLLTPGPTPMPEAVRLTLAMDMVHHRKPGFKVILGEIQEGLKGLFGHDGPVIPLACSGTGAMAAVVAALFKPKDQVLVVEGGKFGQRFGEIASARRLDAHILGVPWGMAVAPDVLARTLDAHPEVKGVLVQASETSTGVLNPIRQLAGVTARRDVLLVVDGISAVGVSPLPMDSWGVDCLITGSQKGLMLPPGLALAALSPRAWDRAEKLAKDHDASGPDSYYFNLVGERDRCLENSTLFTPPINLLQGLHTALALMLDQGLESVYAKHWALTRMAREGISALGLEFLAPEHYTWGLTAIRLPAGVQPALLLKAMAEQYGVVMAGGQGPLKGRVIRMGHMGHVDFGDVLAGLNALANCLELCGGFTASTTHMERAARAYDQALVAGPPPA